MTQQLPSILNVHDALQKLETEKYPSEVHGAMCGFLCSNGDENADTWFKSAFQHFDSNNLLHQEAKSILEELFQSSLQQINDPEFDFHLLLPDDETDILSRIQALGDWCQGFLLGLSMGGLEELKKLPENAIEIATDMTEIARAGSSYEITGDEDDEDAFQELVEYIRVGALLIREELRATITTQDNNPVIH